MSSLSTLLSLVIAAAACYRILPHLLHRWAVAHLTVIDDVRNYKPTPSALLKCKGTAVVCGGSFAGLLAARVCSEHFKEVIVIDPDNDHLVEYARKHLPLQPGDASDKNFGQYSRARVMQFRTLHGMQILHFQALQKLFPDFRAWLKTIGARVGSPEVPTYINGVNIPPPTEFYSDGIPESFGLSRGAYECLLRGLVARIPNVRFINGNVTGLTMSEDNKRIVAVTYRKDGDSSEVTHQSADLVADCSGTAHAGYNWLKRAGIAIPAKEVYNPHMRYGTTEFTVDPAVMACIVPRGFEDNHLLVVTIGNQLDVENRAFAISHIEHNRIQVVTGGWAYKGNLTTPAEMREYLDSLRQSHPVPRWVYEIVDYLEEEPAKTASSAICSAGRLYSIKYQKCQEIPDNFVAMGDAVMRVNPIFGQGLQKAMIGALVLHSCLERTGRTIPPTLASRFFKVQSTKLESAWIGTKYADYWLDTTEPAEGETLATGAVVRWYLRQLEELELAGDREVVWRKFEIMQWLAPPTALLAPSVLTKVMWQCVRRWCQCRV